eukprot:655340-Rhodomonas_salina.2
MPGFDVCALKNESRVEASVPTKFGEGRKRNARLHPDANTGRREVLSKSRGAQGVVEWRKALRCGILRRTGCTLRERGECCPPGLSTGSWPAECGTASFLCVK